MASKRRSLPIDVRHQVLHEAGYKCANPVCHHILTLDMHHLIPVSDKGPNTADNLLPLCPNCHAMHHRGEILQESVRAWKMLLLSLNEGYDRRSIEVLLTLGELGELYVSGDGVLQYASLIASELVSVRSHNVRRKPVPEYSVGLTDKGRVLIEAWRDGNQEAVVGIDTVSK